MRFKAAIIVFLLAVINWNGFGDELRYVIDKNVILKLNPGFNSEETDEIATKGSEVLLLDEHGEWSLVRKANGSEGYMPSANLSIDSPSIETSSSTQKIAVIVAAVVLLLLVLRGFFRKGKKKSKKKGGYLSNIWENAKKDVLLQETGTVVCKYCGYRDNSKEELIRKKCDNSPSGKHVIYPKGLQSEYTCKVCGRTYKSLKQLTNTWCKGGQVNCKPK